MKRFLLALLTIWSLRVFHDMEDVVRFLSTLPTETSIECKVVYAGKVGYIEPMQDESHVKESWYVLFPTDRHYPDGTSIRIEGGF